MYFEINSGANKKLEEREIRTVCIKARELFL